MEKLTPLRNWEKEEKFQVSNSAKLTKKELKRVLWLLAPTFAFILVTILFLGLDLSIARLIDVFARFYEVYIAESNEQTPEIWGFRRENRNR